MTEEKKMGSTSSKRKKRKKRKIIIFVIEILILLVLLAALYVWSKLQRIDREPGLPDTEDIVNSDLDESTQEVLKGYTNVALFALDNRSNGNYAAGNSDVIMIASINNDTKEVKIASVYRDTYLNVNTDGTFNFRKANYAYNKGGVENAIKMLNQNLDLDITDYVVVDFEAMIEAIDLMGGIEATVDEGLFKFINTYINETASLTERKAHFLDAPGTYLLDGVQATAYCRVRYDVNDFRRAQRQREILSKMVAKAKKSNILTINKIIDSVLDDISTSFTNAELFSLASQMMSYELVDTCGFPYKLYDLRMGKPKGDVVVPCDLVTNVKELHKYLFGDYNYTPSNTVVAASAEIVAETGLGLGDEKQSIGVSEDDFVQGQGGQSEDTSAAGDTSAGE